MSVAGDLLNPLSIHSINLIFQSRLGFKLQQEQTTILCYEGKEVRFGDHYMRCGSPMTWTNGIRFKWNALLCGRATTKILSIKASWGSHHRFAVAGLRSPGPILCGPGIYTKVCKNECEPHAPH
jgi:hypothetical protein